MEGIGCASRSAFFAFLFFGTRALIPSIYQTRARRRMQPYIHLNFSISILNFEDFFWICLVCAYVSRLVLLLHMQRWAELEIVQPGLAADQGPPNGAKSDTRSQICGRWLSYLCLFYLRSPTVVCVSEKGTLSC